MKNTITTLMAFGLDNVTAGKISKSYTVTQLRECDIAHLHQIGIPEAITERLLSQERTPIPDKIAIEILQKSAFTCCVCKTPGLPIVIHHIVKWEQSRSHDLENLSVLCLNHHGEAHSKYELSRNLTPELIRKCQKDWVEKVEQKGNQEQGEALANIQQYKGRWDYFNINYIYGLLSDHNIRFNSRYAQDLLDKNYISESKIINSDKLTTMSTHWLDFHDGGYIKLYVEEMVNAIINSVPIIYLSKSIYMQKTVVPGELCLLDGDFHFKCLTKHKKGINQTRRAVCNMSNLRFEGEFDAWYCNTSSSHGSHLLGSKPAVQLCLIRSIEHNDGVDVVYCTIVGLGLNLTKPDIMSQLTGNIGRLLTMQADQAYQAYENELDQIADLTRGEECGEYYDPPPKQCDICKISLANKKYMIDGGVKKHFGWAIMCPDCHRIHGNGIGWGLGQLYRRQDDQWLMVAGSMTVKEGDLDDE